ncbi:MAG: LysR family transcriptional regulator [Hyphomicrobiales bacterium]|nr:LysR family transcriptional regulator [Hyphomicrobiales bacterium]
MELHHLRCFLAAADELHFGRAAQRMEMMPSGLGRQIRLLEDSLGVKLFARTTRAVSLTDEGVSLRRDARDLLARADAIQRKFRDAKPMAAARRFRIGAIDSASAGLLPLLLKDLHDTRPEISVQLFEDKTVRLMPKIVSGALDMAFVRPPVRLDRRIEFHPLLQESPVVALQQKHRLANRKSISLAEIATEPLIVPDRRSRPHSHDLTMKLFDRAGISPQIAEVADEKQTIVNMVSAGLGAAIVPRWTSRMAISGVRYIKLRTDAPREETGLPLAAAWLRGSRDPRRDAIVALLMSRLAAYARSA